jgi:DNA-binding response OmpR family regulator
MNENTKIVIVDDDNDIRKALRVILENENYKVFDASNKKDGYETIKSVKPDLAILDVMMDTMQDGFDLSKDIRKIAEFKNLPIILLTGIDNETGVSFKSAFGITEMMPVDAYIEKPILPNILLTEVKKLLSKKS